MRELADAGESFLSEDRRAGRAVVGAGERRQRLDAVRAERQRRTERGRRRAAMAQRRIARVVGVAGPKAGTPSGGRGGSLK